MDIVASAKSSTRALLRKAGVDVHRVAHTLPAVRSRILAHLDVDLVLDVGSNRGQYARALRDEGYAGHIVSFEPLHDAFAQLTEASADDPSWEPLEVAVGDRDGKATIHVAANSVSSSLLPMTDVHVAAAPQSQVITTSTVDVIRLDSLPTALLGRPRRIFLKADVQGFELAVLRGGTKTLERTVAIESELSLVELYQGQPLLDEVVAWIRQYGFVPVWLEKGLIHPDTGHLLQVDGLFVRAS